MVATTAASSGPAESWPSRSMPVSSRAETSYPSTSASLASVRATGVAPATSSRGATPTGSTKTSSPPPDGQVLTAATTPGSSTAAGSSATAACISAGVMRTSRGWPSASAASASLMTIGSEQAPPTQPDNRPSGVTTALSPTRADTGGSTRTTVARACAPLTATTVSSSRSHEALLVHGRPYLVAGHGHVDVGDAQRRQRVEHRGDVGRRRAHGGGLAHALGADRVVRRGRHRSVGLEPGRLPRGRKQVVGEIRADAVALLVEGDQLHRGDPEALGEAAVDLALDDHRVDAHPTVVHRDHLAGLPFPGALVEVD